MDSSNWRAKASPLNGSPSPPHQQQQRSNRSELKPSAPLYSRGLSDSRGNFRKPLNDENAERAISEDRRLWVGNMPYCATVQDVETMFEGMSTEIEAINMSVDPMTGRNPSYCFIDFTSEKAAARAMQEFHGRMFLGRPLGVKPGTGKGRRRFVKEEDMDDGGHEAASPAFDRWRRTETPREMNTAVAEHRRLWVGSLPRFRSQGESEAQIRAFFESRDFRPTVISKVVSNHHVPGGVDAHRNYCFVDFGTAEEADAARRALNRTEYWGSTVLVNLAKGTPRKIDGRERMFDDRV